MSKKIMVLNGSPVLGGNTSALIAAFCEGAQASGNTVTEFSLNNMDIRGCQGCFGGHSARENPCVQSDDMRKIYPAMRDSNIVVFASPLYYWTLSGQLKTTIDRLFALEEADGNLLRGGDRACILLMAAEGHGFDDAATYYDHLAEHLRWKNLGKVLCGGVLRPGDIDGKPELTEARALGRSIH